MTKLLSAFAPVPRGKKMHLIHLGLDFSSEIRKLSSSVNFILCEHQSKYGEFTFTSIECIICKLKNDIK